ncbi:hypothetical protein N431DRAFT_462267 [Stipitochalara longipes BDJ]|nr:hypothetical protein N431DRAFT_462267 [Stipitochalara longipes BDJ]
MSVPSSVPSSVPLEIVKKYAPAAAFNEYETALPCSIEYLCGGNTSLNYRKWSLSSPATGQGCITPKACVFLDHYTLVYKSNDSTDIYVTQTMDPGNSDPANWKVYHLDNQGASQPDLDCCVFNNILYIVYTDTSGDALWVTYSSDLVTWKVQRIDGQAAYGVSLTAMGGTMYMAYSSSNSSHMQWSSTTNGTDWTFQGQIRGEDTNCTPCLVTQGDCIRCVFSSSTGSPSLLECTYTVAHGWTDSVPIPGQTAFQVALAVDSHRTLLMAYSSNTSSQFYASRSTNGDFWDNTQEIPNTGSVPSLTFFQNHFWLSWTGTDSAGTLNNSYLASDLAYNFAPITNPTQGDLAAHSSPDFYLDVNSSVWNGQALGSAPMYFAIQGDSVKNTLTIHYIFLYAYQPGQTIRVKPVFGSSFDALVWKIGYHQADVEHFAVQLDPKTFEIQQMDFEADGNPLWYPQSGVNFVDGTHAVVSVAMAGHGIWNRKAYPADFVVQDDYDEKVVDLQFGPFFNGDTTKDKMWRTWEMADSNFKQLGLDASGNPISDQIWSKFQGRLGISEYVSLDGGSYRDGSDLSSTAWGLCKSIFSIGGLLNKIPVDKLRADGPVGPGTRPWISNPIPTTLPSSS